jgi:hypothetical protein
MRRNQTKEGWRYFGLMHKEKGERDKLGSNEHDLARAGS